MSDIVIRGIEMPKDKQYSLTIFPNGKVIQHWDGIVFGETKAVELEQHGDLIDRSDLPTTSITDYAFEGHTVVEYEDVQNAPTILEASEAQEKNK